jgi:twitching motility protein PilT
MPIYADVVSDVDVAMWVEQCTDERARSALASTGEADVAYEIESIGRFRVNIFKQRGRLGMCCRVIKNKIPVFEELSLPVENLKKLASLARGLVLVTGIAGSGKSTSIAAMLDYVNENFSKHIVTIEDPIEYVYQDKRSIIDQREIGHDTMNFENALKYVVRQSPDIIMIGEMRDKSTMEAAMHAAETGHLVFSTLHTPNAMQTVDRIMNFFDPHEHPFVRQQLSQLLEGVVSQRLIPTKDLSSRVPACEIMMATPTVRELLMQGKVRELYRAIKEGKYFGCQTFNQSLKEFLDRDLITVEDAINNADSPEELRLELRGITKDAGRGMH